MDERVIIPLTTAMRRMFNVTHSHDGSRAGRKREGRAARGYGDPRARSGTTPHPAAGPRRFSCRHPGSSPPERDGLGHSERVLLAVTALSPIVAGIVLMNLMLLSVTERVTRSDLEGRLAGSGEMSSSSSCSSRLLLPPVAAWSGWCWALPLLSLSGRLTAKTMEIFWEPGALALSLSLLVGLAFGLLPARRAARLTRSRRCDRQDSAHEMDPGTESLGANAGRTNCGPSCRSWGSSWVSPP